MLRPNALAVLRLMIIENFAGICTGERPSNRSTTGDYEIAALHPLPQGQAIIA